MYKLSSIIEACIGKNANDVLDFMCNMLWSSIDAVYGFLSNTLIQAL